MHSIQSLARAASFSGPLSPSNTVLGKRRALADEHDVDLEQPDTKRTKGCAVLSDELDTSANKENIPPFALGPRTASRRPTTLFRRASTGPGPGGAGAGAAQNRLRRSVSYASPSTPTKSTAPAAAWAFSLPDDASSVSLSPW